VTSDRAHASFDRVNFVRSRRSSLDRAHVMSHDEDERARTDVGAVHEHGTFEALHAS
jgi:hypothetical protein